MGIRRRGVTIGWVSALALAVLAAPAPAFEADQFTLPPERLEDLGPSLQWLVQHELTQILEELNGKIDDALAAAVVADSEQERARQEQRVRELMDERLPAKMLFDRLGPGWPEAKVEAWIKTTDFKTERPARFELDYGGSVYGKAVVIKPLMVFGLSPTVRVHGSLMGVDKVGHFFQQGYEYYEVYLEAEANGAAPEEARVAAVTKGVEQENTIYGKWPTGAYSNADLAANYAGMKFYLNLTRPVRIGDQTRPPILIRGQRRWAFNFAAGETYLEPFVSDHFNEAMNPSAYDKSLRETIRKDVLRRRDAWLGRYGLTRKEAMTLVHELATWHGEGYGHSGFDDLITPANTFYDDAEDDDVARR